MGAERVDDGNVPSRGSARRRAFSRRTFVRGAAIGVGAATAHSSILSGVATAATNLVREENALAGTDEWDLPFLDDSIEGFAAEFSVNAGEVVDFKIRTVSTGYRVDIYRLGWYGGLGGRKCATVLPTIPLPQQQPSPIIDEFTGLIDCGNWSVSCSWAVPPDAVSGVYVANMVRVDEPEGLSNRAIFVVRNDGRASDVLVQTSDTTYQAYNDWGGNSLYTGTANWDRAVKVSYNRPTTITELENDFWYAEYPLVRWLERNGFDVSYTTCIDTDRRGSELLNHKIFVSSGHDEYWSKAQRLNVEAARDAGVNLIFMTGNEVFWKVRWEADENGSPYRILVCYKETLAGAKIDPNPEWTGTWRDSRFSPPGDGGRPESLLTGTLFKAIIRVEDSDFPIEVPHTYGPLRFWRSTTIAELEPGESATLSRDTLGYEFNTDDLSAGRPAGLIRLSETTVNVDQVLRDEGKYYTPGPITHYMTMYRAASSALVWSTGTVQWSWGLDAYHPNRPNIPVPVDRRMQQATLNVLADMGAQPTSLQSGLTPASQSGDAAPPTTTITFPPADAEVPIGSTVVISGTCADVEGVVAGVEVSVDAGATWHPAAGTGTWNYQFVPTVLGPITVLVRGIDDSCNIESPKAARLVGIPRGYPCSLWGPDTPPPAQTVLESTPLELGVRFKSSVFGFATGVRFYKAIENSGPHVGRIWSSDGRLLAAATFEEESPSGWQTATLSPPVPIDPDVSYVVSYSCLSGRYSADPSYFQSDYSLAPLSARASTQDAGNGLYGSPGAFPNQTFGASNYWVDVVFDIDNHATPSVLDHIPAHGVSAVEPTSSVVVAFSELMDESTIVVDVRDAAGIEVAGSLLYDSASRSVSFFAEDSLAPLTTFEATLSAARDLSGESITQPTVWEFTTVGPEGTTPTSIWTSSALPALESVADELPVELGLRFRSDVDGNITGVRFYKGEQNTGTHVGRLWTNAGVLLASTPFQRESLKGWQEARFADPVPVFAGTSYVVSYYAPNGGYSADLDYFSESSITRGPLTALATPAAGSNGLYKYGSGGGFPNSSFRSTNYWVDVVLDVPDDTTVPRLVNWVPASAIQGVSPTEPVLATFERPISSDGIEFTVSEVGGSPVAGTIAVDDSQRTASFVPSAPLAAGASMEASVFVTSATGVPMEAPFQWTFVVATNVGDSPATIWDTAIAPQIVASDDAVPVQLGLKFRSDSDGVITGLRFHKATGNSGPHVGSIWTAAGDLLGTVNFEEETAVGWQQANFSVPIPISAGSTYVASYLAPAGRYSATVGALSEAVHRPPLHTLPSASSGGNGVYRYGAIGFPSNSFGATSYLVDVVFADNVGPQVVEVVPRAGEQDVPVASEVTAVFSEPMRASSIVMEVRDELGAVVPSALAYDETARTARLVPLAPLASNSVYTAYVGGGEDHAGNAITHQVVWSFTTRNSAIVTLFGSAVPSIASNDDTSPLELGLRFSSSQQGSVNGVRFFKGPANSGAHVGRLWTASGQVLAETAFSNETSSGWQVAYFSSPVPLEIGAPYIVSYYAPNGGFSLDFGYFAGGDVVNGPLTGIGSPSAPNGVFRYGTGGGFPNSSVGGSNYWVDVIFELSNA